MNTVFIPFEMYSLGCTQLNTLAIMITAFNLYLDALSTGLYTAPDIQAFFMVWNFYNKNHRCKEWQI